mmetsp:Transcript_205/g.353  ORF Transcript_205/g.353 Transcript_205/m.353 type:complete len:103 (-) Transcript_205:1200-1508(-)
MSISLVEIGPSEGLMDNEGSTDMDGIDVGRRLGLIVARYEGLVDGIGLTRFPPPHEQHASAPDIPLASNSSHRNCGCSNPLQPKPNSTLTQSEVLLHSHKSS